MREKNVFIIILLLLSILLIVLPFLVTFNDILTRIVEQNMLYVWVQKTIVPVEAKMMGVILGVFGYSFGYSPSNSTVVVNGLNMAITWNCLGWQSLVLLLATFLFGLGKKYTKMSILETIGIGLVGTFWVNIARMLFTVFLAVHLQPVFRIVFHDYLAALTTVIWLFFFWWFVYSFVLEEKESSVLEEKAV
ncbi:MAG: hypothetical protein A3D74_04585 [Candidatus Levybacteria bacterium RIFCSPHIGHO2_02_FULL_37_13]|nr:MAG: hypothetical protein A3D74_04585 [Candidatus Levybacteria bacterium RIFCSPHIGHO2_02_FULL_37_13]OGH29147.1 MAG: hypothetical protein A3E40_05410 [Candidatus Levybacteria bacterium RIFCSPHIGHO2_12_FULL_37_9]OGH39376.1 MAG: hypothetical protein A3B41_03865 [Candidatus Levybacteria bacterium RIFCSPLOWO2_01_FULL_37_26]